MKNVIEDLKNCDWLKVILSLFIFMPVLINDSTNLFWDKYEFAKCYITALGIIYVVLFIRRELMKDDCSDSRSAFAEAISHMPDEELQEELKIVNKFDEICNKYIEIIEKEIDKRANCRMNGTNED